MKKSLVLILLAVLIAGLTLVSFWGGKTVCVMVQDAVCGMSKENALYSKLNLSSEQKERIEKLDETFHKETDALCMNLCRERMALLNLINARNPDSALVQQKIEEIGTKQVAFEKKIAGHMLMVKSMLNEDQKGEFAKQLNQKFQQTMKQYGYGEILQ